MSRKKSEPVQGDETPQSDSVPDPGNGEASVATATETRKTRKKAVRDPSRHYVVGGVIDGVLLDSVLGVANTIGRARKLLPMLRYSGHIGIFRVQRVA